MRKGKVWINRLMANRPITTDRRGEWDILLNCIKKSPAMPGFSFVCEWREKRFRTGRAVFSEWHVCFRFRCRFLYLGMTAVWRVSDLTKFPDRGCFKPVCLCRGCSDRPVRTVDNVCISKKRHRTPFCGARCRVFRSGAGQSFFFSSVPSSMLFISLTKAAGSFREPPSARTA